MHLARVGRCGAQGSRCRAPVRPRRAAEGVLVLVLAPRVGEAGVCASPRSAEARGV